MLADDPRSELKDFGTIAFTTHNTSSNAELIVVDEKTPKATVAHAICEAWDLDSPGLLLRVTGSVDYDAGETAIASMESVLEGVVYAVSSANGFIFSTGTDRGAQIRVSLPATSLPWIPRTDPCSVRCADRSRPRHVLADRLHHRTRAPPLPGAAHRRGLLVLGARPRAADEWVQG